MFTRLLQAYLILVIVVLAIVSLALAIKSGSLMVGVGIFVAGMIRSCKLMNFTGANKVYKSKWSETKEIKTK